MRSVDKGMWNVERGSIIILLLPLEKGGWKGFPGVMAK